MKKVTTLEMEIELMSYFDIRKNVVVPNVSDWSALIRFEADIISLTKSGFATVTEIKVSKSDLKADLKKRHIKDTGMKSIFFEKIKYFNYAVPKYLEKEALAQIPDFAGLLVLEEIPDFLKEFRPSIYKIEPVRVPTLVYNYKWSEEERVKLLRLGAMRILTLKKNILKLKNNPRN